MPTKPKQQSDWDVVSASPVSKSGWDVVSTSPVSAELRPAGLRGGIALPGFPVHSPAPVMSADVPSDGSMTGGSRLSAAAYNFGGHAIDTVKSAVEPFRHPLHQLRTYPGTVGAMQQLGDQAASDRQMLKTDPLRLAETAGGDLAGNVAVGEAVGRAPSLVRAAGGGMERVGSTMQDSGATRYDTYLNGGKSLPAGSGSPGLRVLQEGPGTSLAMGRIAQVPKIKAALAPAGQAVADAVNASSATVPWSDVRSVVDNTISGKKKIVSGPGGNPNLGPRLDQLRTTFEPAIDLSGNATMPDLYAGRRTMDQNINWNRGPDPIDATVRNATRTIRGGVKDLMYSADPALIEPNERYADLALARKLAERNQNTAGPGLMSGKRLLTALGAGATAGALTHSPSIGGAIGAITEFGPAALESVPAQTGIATGSYQGGRLLSGAGSLASKFPVLGLGGRIGAVPILPTSAVVAKSFSEYQKQGSEDDQGGNRYKYQFQQSDHALPSLFPYRRFYPRSGPPKRSPSSPYKGLYSPTTRGHR